MLAAKQLNIKEVPCVRVDDLTEEQVKALRIVDNKSNESAWDMEFLLEELANVDLSGFDFYFGIEDEEEVEEYEQTECDGIEKKLLKCPVCGHINEEKAFKNYEDTE